MTVLTRRLLPSKTTVLLKPFLSKRKSPINLQESDLSLFETTLEQYTTETTLLSFENIKVNSDGLLFKNISILPHSFADPPRTYLRTFLGFLKKNYLSRGWVEVTKNSVWFTNNWSSNYFHWMTDAIPRLFSVMHLIPNSTVLLPYHYRRLEYVRSSLRPFGISDLRFVPEDQVFCLTRLLLPSETAVTGNYNDDLIKRIRAFYKEFYCNRSVSQNCGDKIYISRRNARRRGILNEDEVVSLLQEYGFKIFSFEDLSFDEQATIASKARYLIGNHGSGLTNMLFMNSGNFVLELRKKGDGQNNCYFSMASALDLKYLYQACRCENDNDDAHAANVANIIVDLKMLRDNIEFMLSRGT